MIDHFDIARADRPELDVIYHQLRVTRMRLDKVFTAFLDNASMPDDNVDAPDWITYRKMMKEYGNISSLIKTAEYYLR